VVCGHLLVGKELSRDQLEKTAARPRTPLRWVGGMALSTGFGASRRCDEGKSPDSWWGADMPICRNGGFSSRSNSKVGERSRTHNAGENERELGQGGIQD